MALVPIPIDGLPAATLPLTGTELIPLMQGGVTVQTEAENWPFDYPATGAVVRTMYEKMADMLSVKDFGAVGDGIADDFAAIQAALDAVAAQGGGTVYFPVGTFRITAPLVVDSNFTILRGSGSSAGGTQIIYPATLDGIRIRALQGCGVRDLAMQPASTATAGIGINCLAADGFSVQSFMRIDSVNLSGCWIAAACWPNVTNAAVTNCVFSNARSRGLLIGNVADGASGGYLVQGCTFTTGVFGVMNLYFYTCTQARVVGCNFSGGHRHVVVSPEAPTTETTGLTITGCTFAGQVQYGVIISAPASIALNLIAIAGNVFIGSGVAISYNVDIGSGHLTVSGNVFQHTSTTVECVNILGGAAVAVTGNSFQGAVGLSPVGVSIGASTDTVLVSSNSFANFVDVLRDNSAGNQNLAVSNIDNYGVLNVPAANPLVLFDWGFFFNVQGSVSFSSVTKVNQVGRMVVLKFEAGGLTVSSSATLKIGANFVTTVNDTLTLVCDGVKWYEVARSVNAA